MADRYEVTEALAVIEAAIGKEIPDSTTSLWCEIFKHIDADLLRRAVIKHASKSKLSFVPMPGVILELAEKIGNRDQSRAAASIECDKCNSTGLVPREREHPRQPKTTLTVMTTCDCPLGHSKDALLNSERRKGRISQAQLLKRERDDGVKWPEKEDRIPF